ncbi:MAG: hypothetical protein WB460_21595 [Candidatus Acidiferrales bacterium]
MNRMNIFQLLRGGRFSALAALVGLGLLFTASSAKAGCAPLPYKAGAAPLIPFVSPHGDDQQEGEDSNGPASIVGLWHLAYTGKTDDNFPPGGPYPPLPFQFLESFKTWHADGTEFENAFLPPADGDICVGVWKDSGNRRVKLHHVGVMFATEGNPPAYLGNPPEYVTNVFTVDETDTVAPNGATYSGFFDFKLFLPTQCANSATGYVCTGTPIAEVTGTTAGTRITVD